MSGIYIPGMEMPEHCGYCRFRYDGICHALQKHSIRKKIALSSQSRRMGGLWMVTDFCLSG